MAATVPDGQPFERLTIEPAYTSSTPQFPWKTASIIAAGAATTAAGWWLLRWRHRYVKRSRRKLLLSNFRESMLVPVEHLQQIRDEFQRQLEAGLTAGGRSSLLMLPTMVDVLPSGRETGTFYAIDWGGTNFRTACITLSKKPHKVGEVEMKSYPITDDMKKGPVAALLDLMAERMVEFAAECGESMTTEDGGEEPILGFCFSFPVSQTALDHGALIRWTKGFDLTGAIDEDPVRLLAEAFKRRKLPVQVKVLINDAPGVMAAGRYMNPTTMIGVILGTGTNACYAEQVSRIEKLPADYQPRTEEMCINTEWGAFNADCLPLMEEDRDLDAESVNPEQAIFEKLVSGLYLGEVACRMMLKLAREGDLFAGRVPEQLHGPVWPFDASFVARIHGDETHDLHVTADLIHQAFGYHPDTLPYGARANTKFVCKLVGQRGATLMAAALAALLRHMGRHVPATLANGGDEDNAEEGEVPQTTVAVDGSMFLKYDKFKAAVMVGLAQIEGKHVANKVVILPTEDGSSIGAACLASAAKAFAGRQQQGGGK